MDPEVLQWNGVDYVPKASFDGLTAELLAMTNDRDYHRRIAIEQSAYWRNQYSSRFREAHSIIGDISGDIAIFTNEMRGRIMAFLARSSHSGGTKYG